MDSNYVVRMTNALSATFDFSSSNVQPCYGVHLLSHCIYAHQGDAWLDKTRLQQHQSDYGVSQMTAITGNYSKGQ